ncbi:MAG: hypothetical protein RLN62_04230 [Rickettsiales bacterium]
MSSFKRICREHGFDNAEIMLDDNEDPHLELNTFTDRHPREIEDFIDDLRANDYLSSWVAVNNQNTGTYFEKEFGADGVGYRMSAEAAVAGFLYPEEDEGEGAAAWGGGIGGGEEGESGYEPSSSESEEDDDNPASEETIFSAFGENPPADPSPFDARAAFLAGLGPVSHDGVSGTAPW